MYAQESVMDIQKEREAFESWWEVFHNGRQIACDYVEEDNSYSVGYSNAQWVAWQAAKAQAVPEGFVLVNAESLSLHAKSIRMFSNGNEENYYYEIENHVCAIEAMIEAQEPTND